MGDFPLGECARARSRPLVGSLKSAPVIRSIFLAPWTLFFFTPACIHVTVNSSPRAKSHESRPRSPPRAAAWPAVAGRLVLPRPSPQPAPTRRDLKCHLGQLCWPNLEQMEANLKRGVSTRGGGCYVILPFRRQCLALS